MFPGGAREPLKFPSLQYCRLGMGGMQGVSVSNFNINSVPDYDFSTELKALSLVQRHRDRAAAEAKSKEEWLKGRAESRKQKEISALKDMQDQRKRQMLEQKRRQEAEAARKIQEAVEAKQQAEREQKMKLQAWSNIQLDLTGGLISPQQEEMLRNFQTLCGVSDDHKSLQLLVHAQWDPNAATNAYFSTMDLDRAIANLAPRPPPQAAPQATIEVTYPDGKIINFGARPDDTLWALYANVAQNLGHTSFHIYNKANNACLTSNETSLSATFASIGMTGFGRVYVRPNAT